MSQLMALTPSERISAKAALDHPYFDSLDKSQYEPYTEASARMRD